MKNKFLIVLAALLFLIPLIVSQTGLPTDIKVTADMWTTGSSQPAATAVSATTFEVAITKPAMGKTTFDVEEEIQFEGVFIGPGSPANWKWDFKDGSSIATEKTATHKYSKDGTYNVQLSVTSEGKLATTTITVVIKKPVFTECKTILQCLAMIDQKFVESIFGK